MFGLSSSADLLREAHWSLELLGQLDWHRFQELVSRILHLAGYLPGVSWVRPDGAAALTMVHPLRTHRLEALVQCAPWIHQPGPDAAALRELQAAVAAESAQRGIYITPGFFREDAWAFAQTAPTLELVDGSDLLRILHRLEPGERSALLHIITVGSCMIPSCPSCLRKMELLDDCAAALGETKKDVIYRDRRTENREVDCRTLTLRRRAAVVFMKNVTTGSMTVHGRATGNIVVNGRLHIARGGCLSGLVSARAIQLDPGGTLEAEARILNERALDRLHAMPVRQIWRCTGHPKCRATLPVRGT